MKNSHGLAREIPEAIKRAVRQRCGFGCVICGSSIVDYEHVEPEFSDAKHHDPMRIALLCPGHHAQVTRKFMAKATVKAAMEAPKCKQIGFSFGEFDPALTPPFFKIAGVTLKNCPIPIQIGGAPLFLIEPPEENGGPYRLSARFFNAAGLLTLHIHRNEWRASATEWDLVTSGGRITIRSAPGDVSLQIRFVPAEGIAIEKLDMLVAGIRFEGNENVLEVTTGCRKGKFTNCIMDNCGVGMSF